MTSPTPYLIGTALAFVTLEPAMVGLLFVGGAIGWSLAGLYSRAFHRQKRAAEADAVRAATAEASTETFRRVLMDGAFPLPVVRISETVEGGTFNEVNGAAVEHWGRTAEEMTSTPYPAFVSTDASATEEVARRIDAGDDGSGHVNAFRAGSLHARPGSDRWQRWLRWGDYWIAYPLDEEIRAKTIADGLRDERDDAVSDLEAMRPAVDAILRTPVSNAALPPAAIAALTQAADRPPAGPVTTVSIAKTETTTYPDGTVPPAEELCPPDPAADAE